jgi:hypothetical protein
MSNSLRLTNICIKKSDNGQREFWLAYYDDKKTDFLISVFKEEEEE